MGLFGGGNSSSSTSSQSAGFSNITGPALQIKGSGNRLTMTDDGAVSGAFGLVESIAGEALSNAQVSAQNQASSVSQAINAVQQASQGQAQNIATTAIKWGALAALAYFAMRALSKG